MIREYVSNHDLIELAFRKSHGLPIVSARYDFGIVGKFRKFWFNSETGKAFDFLDIFVQNHRSLRRRFAHQDFRGILLDILCRALDIRSILFDFFSSLLNL